MVVGVSDGMIRQNALWDRPPPSITIYIQAHKNVNVKKWAVKCSIYDALDSGEGGLC